MKFRRNYPFAERAWANLRDDQERLVPTIVDLIAGYARSACGDRGSRENRLKPSLRERRGNTYRSLAAA